MHLSEHVQMVMAGDNAGVIVSLDGAKLSISPATSPSAKAGKQSAPASSPRLLIEPSGDGAIYSGVSSARK
jgi:hypothetical protein